MPSMPVLIFWQDTWDKNILKCPDKMAEFNSKEFCHFVNRKNYKDKEFY